MKLFNNNILNVDEFIRRYDKGLLDTYKISDEDIDSIRNYIFPETKWKTENIYNCDIGDYIDLKITLKIKHRNFEFYCKDKRDDNECIMMMIEEVK